MPNKGFGSMNELFWGKKGTHKYLCVNFRHVTLIWNYLILQVGSDESWTLKNEWKPFPGIGDYRMPRQNLARDSWKQLPNWTRQIDWLRNFRYPGGYLKQKSKKNTLVEKLCVCRADWPRIFHVLIITPLYLTIYWLAAKKDRGLDKMFYQVNPEMTMGLRGNWSRGRNR